MKSIAAFILLIVMLTGFSSRYMIMLNYLVNKNYIAKALCASRNKPMSGCNGKCYLKKQLARAEKEENAPKTNTRGDKNEVLFLIVSKKMITFLFAEENNRQYSSGKQPFTPQNTCSTVFHPPQQHNLF